MSYENPYIDLYKNQDNANDLSLPEQTPIPTSMPIPTTTPDPTTPEEHKQQYDLSVKHDNFKTNDNVQTSENPVHHYIKQKYGILDKAWSPEGMNKDETTRYRSQLTSTIAEGLTRLGRAAVGDTSKEGYEGFGQMRSQAETDYANKMKQLEEEKLLRMKLQEAQQKGMKGKPVPAVEADVLGGIDQSLKLLDDLRESHKRLNPSPIPGIGLIPSSETHQYNSDKERVAMAIGPLLKGSTRVTAEERKMIEGQLPGGVDFEQKRNEKIDSTKDDIMTKYNSRIDALKKAGFDTSNYKMIYKRTLRNRKTGEIINQYGKE